MIIRLLVLIGAMCFASAAQAQIVWSATGSSCVPDHDTIANNRTLVGNASVRHATGNVDPIVLTCGMQRFNNGTTNWALRLTYQDSTGTNAPAFVRARLYRMAVGSSTPVLLATVNSNSSATATLNTLDSADFAHTFDFETSLYWVHIDMDRGADSQTVIFHSVLIEGQAV